MLEALLTPFAGIQEFVDAGGWVVWWILAVALTMWTLIVERAWWFHRIYPQARAAAAARWQRRPERYSWTARRIRTAMIGELSVAMGGTLPLLRALIPICPLLGLLGTVGGMLEVFDVMAIKGQSEPRAMADGVSQAMIATLSGLAVALSGMYFSHHYTARARRETEALNSVLALEDAK
ncbi:MotA/TolQ/ExbB proton channel family protein [Phenylobacterium sp.]|uniref:MotA/TolQ/ExbB proton channel family protein n=1 Tax=Phenylobacterium sp. TaxID=1871053 RepID=UPI00273780BE|nr:MotA/TolQ/ExbB proton channel family protein [Phenylobacterium sp.]MDP3870851.1 MotA/TolQ/ExbB proton channel family protein [Phenylobacterium sp.]